MHGKIKIDVKRHGGFRYAFHGVDVVEYLPGVHEVPHEVAELAIREKWAVAIAPAVKSAPAATASGVAPPPGADEIAEGLDSTKAVQASGDTGPGAPSTGASPGGGPPASRGRRGKK